MTKEYHNVKNQEAENVKEYLKVKTCLQIYCTLILQHCEYGNCFGVGVNDRIQDVVQLLHSYFSG